MPILALFAIVPMKSLGIDRQYRGSSIVVPRPKCPLLRAGEDSWADTNLTLPVDDVALTVLICRMGGQEQGSGERDGVEGGTSYSGYGMKAEMTDR